MEKFYNLGAWSHVGTISYLVFHLFINEFISFCERQYMYTFNALWSLNVKFSGPNCVNTDNNLFTCMYVIAFLPSSPSSVRHPLGYPSRLCTLSVWHKTRV